MFFFFFKQKTAYEIGVRLVGSEMCIRDSSSSWLPCFRKNHVSKIPGAAEEDGPVLCEPFIRFGHRGAPRWLYARPSWHVALQARPPLSSRQKRRVAFNRRGEP